MGKDVILKTSALMTMNASQDPIDVKPFVNKDLCNGNCPLVNGNEGQTEFGESISHH